MSEGEEKTEEPSDRKLKKARDDGKIATYKDFVSSALSAVLFFYIIIKLTSINDSFKVMFLSVLNQQDTSFENTIIKVIPSLISSGTSTVIPLCALAFISVVVFTVVVNGGIVLSFKPLKPDIKRVNPADGLKKIFGSKAFIDLGKSLLKLIVLAAALYLTTLTYLNDLIRTPVGGLEGLPVMLAHVSNPIIFISIGIFIILGVMDLPLQYFLFRKDQKSTKSEVKRENKESDGAPELKRERKRMEKELADMPTKIGVKNSSFVVYNDNVAVGLRYVAGETHVPFITSRAKTGDAALKLIEQARELKIPLVKREELSDGIAKQHQIGAYLNAKYFNGVAEVLREAKLV
jgi:type III secretion protein U